MASTPAPCHPAEQREHSAAEFACEDIGSSDLQLIRSKSNAKRYIVHWSLIFALGVVAGMIGFFILGPSIAGYAQVEHSGLTHSIGNTMSRAFIPGRPLPGVANAEHLSLSSSIGGPKRSSTIEMKGRGRGIGGGRSKGGYPGGGDTMMRKRRVKNDFDRDEWQFVCKDSDLGAETGSTKAVEAGQDYKGNKYLWTLVRGDPASTDKDADKSAKSIWAIEGTCRCCLFPLTNGAAEKVESDNSYALTCGLCGTKYSLLTGEVLEFLPAKNPVQWASKKANEKKGPQRAAVLPTRVGKRGKVYVRLPDGTLTKDVAPLSSQSESPVAR